MKPDKVERIKEQAAGLLKRAHIAVTPRELAGMEVAAFGLGDVERLGLELIVYENNDRYCAKELVMLPWQICPEHRHPDLSRSRRGKRETFRCRYGEVYLYVPGEPTPKPKARVPRKYAKNFTVWKEIVLRPGDQFTLPPDTLHWFQAGAKGAVVSEFSSTSTDENDIFTDPAIRRVP